MYSLTVVNSTGEYTLFNTYDDTLKVVNPVLSLELNKSGTLTFQISPDHPNLDQILPQASEIYVYDGETVYWIGRPLEVEGEFDLMRSVTCEGILGYLLDTQVPPFDFTEGNSIKGTDCVKTFLQRLINSHNSRLTNNWVDSRKKFTVGTVSIVDSNNNLARSSEDYHNTLETINDKLLSSTLGGYIRVRVSGSIRYIDYIGTFGAASQPITFGENLLDLTTHLKTETLYTVVIPQGAEIEDTGQRVNLLNYTPSTSVANQIKSLTHGGAKYNTGASNRFASSGAIYDAEGVNRHGRVFVELTMDDITTQEQLALKAAKYIGEVSVLGETLELSAVDLSSINVEYTRFNLGEYAQVISLPHDVQAEYQISQMNIDLYNPAGSSMTLGGELRTFTFENTKQAIEFNNKVTEEVTSAVKNATALLSGGLGGYLYIKRDDSGQPYEILIMNAATETAATNCVRMNQNGIGFGRKSAGQGASSWVYRNAWTIDGNLIADFITTGTLNASLLKAGTINADLIKAGTLQDAAGNTTLNMSNGTLTMKKGSINLGGGSFSVTDAGNLNAKKGTIGGFSIYDTYMRGNKGNAYIDLLHYTDFIVANSRGKEVFSLNTDGNLSVRPQKNGAFTGTRLTVNDGAAQIAFGDNGLYLNDSYARFEYGSGALDIDDKETIISYGDSYFSANSTRVEIKGKNGAQLTANANSIGLLNKDSSVWFSVQNNDIFMALGDTVSTAVPNLRMTDNSAFRLTSHSNSSRHIKRDITLEHDENVASSKLYDVEVVQFRYKEGIIDENDTRADVPLLGFIVEDLNEIYPNAVDKESEDSKNWGWNSTYIIPPMLKLIQDQKKEIDELKNRVEKLEEIILKGERDG